MHARGGSADTEAGGRLLDVAHALDALDVDDEVGLEHAALHLDQKIRSACEDKGLALFLGQQRDGSFQSCPVLRSACFTLVD